ncbi:Ldh family oxidoreductase [Pseudoroseomonas cervicalis]|uniref:Ldh family oxidoreductase n=1 Tax=Teichococcus cervicalis TaxID=204525 RepID=UPI00278421CC|nr:Ldh family oxidoreductase [Pseudoroseomonas cervicalis]MDQ1080162.1 LDH2 family malate/lactate/ureidoglycolate dehydrogenase [Pseudoroseomonas cervicalis]
MLIQAGTIRQQIATILAAWGMPGDLVEVTAEAMVETDLMGIDSHGLSMLMMYEQMRADGQVDLAARPRLLRQGPATALVDGGAGLGHPVAAMAMELAAGMALRSGIAAVGVRNSHHFGAAGHYARLAARRGLLGLVMTTARSVLVVPPRGAMPRLGTNPLALATPSLAGEPGFVLDMSSSTVAGNKVKVYELNGKPMPEGWVVDGAGRPVTDAADGMEWLFRRAEGGLTALGGDELGGGHKGYGLGLMVQILAGTLTGGALSVLRDRRQPPGAPDNIGHFFLAIDPAAFRPREDFDTDLATLLDTMRATPPSHPDRPVLVPGDPERTARAERLEQGIPVPDSLAEKIAAICARAKVDFLLRPSTPGQDSSERGAAPLALSRPGN